MINIIIAIVFSLSFISCKNFDSNFSSKNKSLTFGVFCGECIGNCFKGYYLQSDSVYRILLSDKNKVIEDNQLMLNKEALLNFDETKFIKGIISTLPSDIESYNKEIGKPDNHDQCGIILVFRSTNEKKVILIDTEKEVCPNELHEFIDNINNLIPL